MSSQDSTTSTTSRSSASSQQEKRMASKELPGDSIRRLRSQIQNASKHRLPVSQDPHSVTVDWEKLRKCEGEAKIPVVPFVLCKKLVEDDQGALFLDGTVTQTVLVENLQEGRPPPQLESCDLVFLIKLKLLGYRPSFKRGVLESRGFSLHASKAGLSKGSSLLAASERLDLFHAPLDLSNGGGWGPLRVLKATFDMEFQPQVVDLGSSQSGQAEQDVTCYPDLCSSNKGENVVRVEHAGSLGRLSGRLSLLQEEPTVEFFQEKRLKLDAFEVEGDDGLFVTHPRMRITFWLTSDPVNVRAWLKAACVFLLLAVLDMMNFEEFFGIFAVLQGGGPEPATEAYREYLMNGVVLATAAVFGVTLTEASRGTTTTSRLMVLDWTASMFLLGVALAVCPDPRVALAGCLLSLLAALVAVVWLAVYQFAIWKVMADTRGLPLVVLKEAFPNRKIPVKNDWKRLG